MKRVIASAGVVVMGATQLQAENLTGVIQTRKTWTISATLRSFYDDNIFTSPDNLHNAVSSFGFEFAPSLKLSLPGELTTGSLSYNYSLRYYLDRPGRPEDQSHEVTADLSHRFTPMSEVNLQDSFVVAYEPELIEGGGIISSPLRARSNASVVRNRLSVRYDTTLTALIGAEVGFDTSWFDYQAKGEGSLSALLNRFEHLFHADVRWIMRDNLTTSLGYQLGITEYTSSESLVVVNIVQPYTAPSLRNTVNHYAYFGGNAKINGRLGVDGKAGVEYTTYNDGLTKGQLSPFADIGMNYEFYPGSKIRLGFRHQRNATDVAGVKGNITQDQESSLVYVSANHQLSPFLTGSITAQFQDSTFNGGVDNNLADQYYTLGLNLAYRVNQNVYVDGGYNWDYLNSSVNNRSFTRNRVYLGVRATF